MKTEFRYILSALAAAVFSTIIPIMMPAQTLASLKQDPAVVSGTLASGVSYHIVPSSSAKGFADFALIQKNPGGNADPAANLSHLPILGDRRPHRFFTDYGVGPSEEGFAHREGEAVIYHFRDIPLTQSNVCDSSLLVLFGITAVSEGAQDIVIAGDVNAASIVEKMRTMSLLVGKLKPGTPTAEYVWSPAEDMIYEKGKAGTASVSAIYRSPRTPAGMMNTAQPVVSERFSYELRSILKMRIDRELFRRGVPSEGVRFSYYSSAMGPGDEVYRFTISTDDAHICDAASILAGTLSWLDSHGAGLDEYKTAKEEVAGSAFFLAGRSRRDNASLVRWCSSAFLYGSSLAAESVVSELFSSRDIPAETELKLFNNFMSALLDGRKNLTLRCLTTGLEDPENVRAAFEKAWGVSGPQSFASLYRANLTDTLGLVSPKEKVKIRSTAAELVSGGEIWTFANGVRVIYKKNTSSPGRFSYALMFRGGWSAVKGLNESNATYLSEMLPLFDVAGLRGYDFTRMLRSNGITVRQKASASDLRIYGSAPVNRLSLLLRSLVSISSDSRLSRPSYEYWYRSKGDQFHLEDNYPELVQAYYDRQFSRIPDGYLVIVGDLDAETAKKHLTRIVGGFRTPAVVPNTKAEACTDPFVSERVHVEGPRKQVRLKVTAPLQFTSERYHTLRVAAVILERKLVSVVSPLGYSVSVEPSFTIVPSCSMTMDIHCRRVPDASLPEGVEPAAPESVLGLVVHTMEQLIKQKVPDDELKTCRNAVVNGISSELSSQSGLVQAVLLRYAEGKDIVSGAAKKAGAVTSAQVQELAAGMHAGTFVEYVER